jgi:hypothetical protein
MSRLWCLAVFAPFLNLWVGYRCFACPAGYAYQKKLDPPGIALAVIYWIVMASALSLLAVVAVQLYGTTDFSSITQSLRAFSRTMASAKG